MTRYVKTLEDVRRLQKLYAEPEFEQHRGISGMYETDPEIIALCDGIVRGQQEEIAQMQALLEKRRR